MDAGAIVNSGGAKATHLDAIQVARFGWGLFRDRRPDLYKPLLTLDGQLPDGGPTT